MPTSRVVVCGWCHAATAPGSCSLCGRDPALPWLQRGQDPPTEAAWSRRIKRRQLEDARRQLGPAATVDRIAEHIGVDARTVRRWQEMSG